MVRINWIWIGDFVRVYQNASIWRGSRDLLQSEDKENPCILMITS